MLTRPRRGRSDRVELIDAVVVPANTAIRGKFSGTEREPPVQQYVGSKAPAVSPTRGWVIERQICFAQTDAIANVRFGSKSAASFLLDRLEQQKGLESVKAQVRALQTGGFLQRGLYGKVDRCSTNPH